MRMPIPWTRSTRVAEVLRVSRAGADSEILSALAGDALHQVDALAGQLRSAVELASHATPEGQAEFERTQSRAPVDAASARQPGDASREPDVRIGGVPARGSTGGVRPLGDAIGRAVNWHRTYWLPMTVAIVLKPDFTATFSRGVLRVVGTLSGLAFATCCSTSSRPRS